MWKIDCTGKEIYYINLLKPEYNILNNAGLGYTHSEEGLKRRSVYRHSNLTKIRISNAAFLRKENQGELATNHPKLSASLSPKLEAHLASLNLKNSYKVEITNIRY